MSNPSTTSHYDYPPDINMLAWHTSTIERNPHLQPKYLATWPRPDASLAPADQPLRKINVLGLGGGVPQEDLIKRGVAVARMIGLHDVAYYDGVNRTAFEIASDATPEDHDVVIVNTACVGSYSFYLRALGESMMSRTILYADSARSDRESVERREFWTREYGITRFVEAVYRPTVKKTMSAADHIVDILASTPVIERPDLPDIEIIAQHPGLGVSDGQYDRDFED